MRSILAELALGNLSTEPRPNAQYNHALQESIDEGEKLLALLDEHEKEVFNAYSEAQSELNSFYNVDRFIIGYRLGVLMTMEVFNGKETLSQS